MLVRDVTKDQLRVTMNMAGIGGEITDKGRWLHVRPKRFEPAFRIPPMGANWYLIDYGVENGKAWAQFQNVMFDEHKNLPNTHTLGNADWYALVSSLINQGATVKIGADRFDSQFGYDDWCSAMNLHPLVEAERDIRSEINAKQTA